MSDELPVLRVVRGNPSAADLAALVSVLAALASDTPPPEEPERRRRWAAPAVQLRSPAYGRRSGGWRASGMPQ